MNGRANTLVGGRRERIERILDRTLSPPAAGSDEPIPDETRQYMTSEAEDLYWNELEWEHVTDEEADEDGPITELTFPGLLAYVRGLLLSEVMPDSLSPANPRPQVVEDLLDFLANRVVELEDGLADPESIESGRLHTELDMTSSLIDRVLYVYYGLTSEDIERVEAAQASA